MGCCDDGDAPAALAQTGGSRARMDGSDHDRVARLVSGSARSQAEFDLIGLCAFGLAGPVSAIGSPSGSSAKRGMEPQGAETMKLRLIAPIRPIDIVAGRPDDRGVGA